MALKYREEVVGKRFLALRTEGGVSLPQQKPTSDHLPPPAEWLTGFIRAASETDHTSKDFQVLVEPDHKDWQKREWLKVNHHYNAFLVESGVVLAQRSHPKKGHKKCWWPCLTFTPLVDCIGLTGNKLQPIEFLIDQKLAFQSSEALIEYKESVRGLEPECKEAVQQWSDYQDGQSILVSTPTEIVGYRVRVYRTEGTTQWFTAVIQHYNDKTKQLVLLDDTVLEEHYESAELTQIIPLDDVVELLLKGTEARIAPRRRACKDKDKESKEKEVPSHSVASRSRSKSDLTNQQPATKSITKPATKREEKPRAERKRRASHDLLKAAPIKLEEPKATSPVVEIPKRAQSLDKDNQSSSVITKELKVELGHTSVIRRAPRPQKNPITDSVDVRDSLPAVVEKKPKRAKRQASSETQLVTPELSLQYATVINDVSRLPAEKDPDTPETYVDADMHIKKLRILRAQENNGTAMSPPRDVGPASSAASVIAPPPAAASTSVQSTASSDKSVSNNRIDKLSESSVDGCSSGYSSAATTDSTVSPREREQRLLGIPMSSPMTLPIATTSLGSTPTSVVSANPAARRQSLPSPYATKPKPLTSESMRTNNASSPLVIDTSKESPIVPYRDPELLKRGAEVRKLQQQAVSSAAASRSMAAPPTPAGLSAQHVSAMLNPTLAAQQLTQLNLMQQVNQLQLLEQYQRQLMHSGIGPQALQFSMLQQHQQLAALQQQRALEAMYGQARPQAPLGGAANWMLMAHMNEKQMSDMRELEMKERERLEAREKLEKERAEKERLEREKERKQLQERQERARIIKESAQIAHDAVNQHFTESLKRVAHPISGTPPAQPSSSWNKKSYTTGENLPQDLSLGKHKISDHQRPDHHHQSQADRLDHMRRVGQHITEEQHRAISRQHDAFMRTIQSGGATRSTSQDAKLAVEEHFLKAASQLPSKQESAEYSLYGYQPQSFPNKFVSKDQLQQQLIRDDKSEGRSPKAPKMSPNARLNTSRDGGFSNQLIQEGLIPNPAYMPGSTNSMSALMNMSANAGPQITAGKEKGAPMGYPPTNLVKPEPNLAAQQANAPHPVKSEPGQDSNSQESNVLIKSFKSYVENAVTQAFYKDIEEQQNRRNMDTSESPPNASTKSERSNGMIDTDSDTLSAPSPTLSIKTDGTDAKSYHPKMRLKKEWQARHSEEGNPSTSANNVSSSAMSNHSETTSASETEAEAMGSQKPKSNKRKSDVTLSSSNGQKKTKNFEVSSGSIDCSSVGLRSPAAGGGDSHTDEQNSIRQLAEIALQADRMEAVPYASKPLVRVNIATLKRTGQAFVQDGSCIEMAPKLTKCRECKMTPNQRNKKMPNIFCRFYAFRMLKFSRSGQICIAGFCEPHAAEADDVTIWLPRLTKTRSITTEDVKTAKYIVANVGDEFCRLVEQEQECAKWAGDSSKKRAWKRAVQGVREMCDVCDTTLFNTHWVCHRCGFVVCIDCYRVKRKIQAEFSQNNTGEENRRWLTCTSNKNHEAEKLMLTSIIPGNALRIAGDLIHHVRRKHGIKANCPCGRTNDGDTSPPNGLSQHLLNAVAVSKNSFTNGHHTPPSAESCLALSYPQDGYRQSTFLSASLDSKTLNSYSDDPLSLLADVASIVPSSNGPERKPESECVKVNGSMEHDTETGEKKPCITLRKLLTKHHANGTSEQKVHDMNSTSEEGSPTPLSPNTHIQRVSSAAFAHYQRRSGSYLAGRSQPVPVCNLTETSILYPDVKHSWLCSGRLLRLENAMHAGNYTLFNQRWTLGQPVIISNASKNMKIEELWTPQAFSKEFGHIRHDLIDCRRNEPLTGYQIKHFWDGFEDTSKRLEDSDGNPLILKLKDWPTGEDFAESMPSRFNDLMNALPMPEYTRRNGALNLAGKLPDFFVKPDLGPKMYNAFGLAKYPQSGTTNLHLDISDACNIMVYVAKEDDIESDVMKLIDESDCDEVMKKRVTGGGEVPGALWHIYDACDADKMRDLLNKVALEQGMELEPYHDPIHDQSFYLDRTLRRRLAEEYGVQGYAIIQCVGDAIFIPAGAPHQVQNLNGCIKVAEDFVSPEHLHHCFNLTQEFRHLSNTHSNHEDKLQVKNIIYHAIKDAVAVLDQSDPIS